MSYWPGRFWPGRGGCPVTDLTRVSRRETDINQRPKQCETHIYSLRHSRYFIRHSMFTLVHSISFLNRTAPYDEMRKLSIEPNLPNCCYIVGLRSFLSTRDFHHNSHRYSCHAGCSTARVNQPRIIVVCGRANRAHEGCGFNGRWNLSDGNDSARIYCIWRTWSIGRWRKLSTTTVPYRRRRPRRRTHQVIESIVSRRLSASGETA